ncbi:HNH endonuclease signature motif containing protein [Lentzea aerocolonigenes]|uniref:HNH endonuclease signature motif containing protein n=1 Tax=Lentzea aerocolonigenes TaxID=68170 RepID=UPI000696DCAB|nr:HNH endonuclease signature motif containing protein [Lentzea aerocolonigenes]
MSALGLSSPLELLAELKRKVPALQQLQFEILEIVGALQQQGAAESLGYKDLIELFKHVVHWDPKMSRRKLKQAAALCPTITPTGSVVEPALPAVAAAMAEGALSEDHVDVLAKAMVTLPAKAEEPLVEYALQHEPHSAEEYCKKLAYLMDQDGPEPEQPEPVQPRNVLRRKWQGGRYQLFADVDAETGAKLDAQIDALAKPAPNDLRFAPEREGDAFCEIVNLAARADHHRISGGERVQLTVTVDYDKLRQGIGTARLDNGEHIPMNQVRKIACDSGIIPMLLGSRSQIHDVGRKTRTINAGLRRMLVARDKGCAFPGCTRPPKHCEAHHVRHWSNGGETNLDNLALLCLRHHNLVHHSGWQVQMAGGIPIFRPPGYVDPARRTRTNQLHTTWHPDPVPRPSRELLLPSGRTDDPVLIHA